jgi:uncharacterized protein YqjF (DUF2071 family)
VSDRPDARALDVISALADFAIVTFDVDPARLAALLPDGFTPEVRTLANGSPRAFVSAVPFRNADFRAAFAPWARFAFGQTNYRAYVRRGDERCVWFFGTSLATLFVAVPRYAWRLPWHHATMRFDVRWRGDTCARYRLETRGAWGDADLDLAGTDASIGALDGFPDDEDGRVVLTHPLIGYYRRRDGVLGTYGIWHDRLDLRRANARRARFAVFEELGLVEPQSAPHSVLVQRATEFVILLPPRVAV